MSEKEIPSKPLKPAEVNRLLGLLLRLADTGSNEVIRRLAKSLLNVVSRERIQAEADIQL